MLALNDSVAAFDHICAHREDLASILVIITSHADKPDEARIANVGITAKLSEPFRIEGLLAAAQLNGRCSANVAQ